MALGTGNPYRTSSPAGMFRAYTDGVFQGMADSDPAVQNALNQGQYSPDATAPIFGGMPIGEEIFGGNLSSGKPLINPVTTAAAITGFAVFDQGHNGIITPGVSNVPSFYPGMDVPFYRLGSGARVPVKASSQLVALTGQTVYKQSVAWNFTTNELVPTAPSATHAVSGIEVVETNGVFIGTVTTAAPHGFVADDTVTLAGFTPADYNGDLVVLSVPSPTKFTVMLASNPGAITAQGTAAITAGSDMLQVNVLSVHTNSRIVVKDPVSGNVNWQDGVAAIVQL